MQVLNSVVNQTSVLNEWILSNAPRPKHVRQAAPNMNIAILCLFCDTVNMNHDLGRDFLYGFKLCGLIPDSGKKLKRKKQIHLILISLEQLRRPALLTWTLRH
jgi:hypothetical protein